MRKYRKHQKRYVYNKYIDNTADLKKQLETGVIKQDEWERAQEFLDEKYQYVR